MCIYLIKLYHVVMLKYYIDICRLWHVIICVNSYVPFQEALYFYMIYLHVYLFSTCPYSCRRPVGNRRSGRADKCYLLIAD